MQQEDKVKVLNLLKTVRGQLNGIIQMVEDDRYCVDISKQILSAQALLKKANLKTIDQHIRHCVIEAFETGNEEEKINEVMELIDKYAK